MNFVRKYQILPETKDFVQLLEIDFGMEEITSFDVTNQYLAVSQSNSMSDRGTISIYKTADFEFT